MICFLIHRRDGSGKFRLGFALLPEDLTEIVQGHPIYTNLVNNQIGIQDKLDKLEAVDIYFFRDLEEFRTAMREAGIETRLVINNSDGSRFVGPPINKIGEN